MGQVRYVTEFIIATLNSYLNVLRATWVGQLILFAFVFAVLAATANRLRGGKEDK